ncbi:hypothetical protein RB608_18235 [Nocardioides sp. LHD-245]|uniref:hypothetical protein n=1 Tax=Nocardioides sp. LHD-245 TaxID=3051387 RepID=UPI0027E18785|nr:hypothetical protein [Nocardioides sp. LHD-245]
MSLDLRVLVRIPFVLEIDIKGGAEKPLEGWHDVAADDVVVIDVDAFEDCPVQLAPDNGIGFGVLTLWSAEQRQAAFESGRHLRLAEFEAGDLVLDRGSLGGDARLLLLQFMLVDRVGVERLQRFLALPRQTGEARSGLLTGQRSHWCDRLHVREHEAPDLLTMAF